MNIYDIAQQCGVSIATVSRVLNHHPNVSAATRARIEAAIDAANYTPSDLARRLGTGADAAGAAAPATSAVPTVGLLCANLANPYEAAMLAALEPALAARGYAVVLRQSGDTPAQEQAAIRALLGCAPRALLCLAPTVYEDAAPLAAVAAQTPVILLDGALDAPGVYSITGDWQDTVRTLVEQLMRRQRRRILFLYHRMSHSCRQQLAGFRSAYASAGISVDPALVVNTGDRPEDVNACIKRLLVNRVGFDAVIGAEDLLALGAQKALQRTGLSMPVIGCQNAPMARCATPELSSIDGAPAAFVSGALEVLDALAAGAAPPANTRIPTALVERDTFRKA